MNPILEEMRAIISDRESDDSLAHYGMPRRSGRYPWGSGEDPYQHSEDFLGRVEELRKQKITYTDPKTGKVYSGDTAIAKTLGLTTGQFRTEIAICSNERTSLQMARAKSLKEDGLGPTEIGRQMGVSESTVRSWLNASEKTQSNLEQARNTANFIKEQVDKNGMVDVGAKVERELNISKEKLNQALYLLEREGYPIYKGGVPQATNPGQQTNQRVICKPGTQHKEIYQFDKVHALNEDNYTSRDGGESFEKFQYPASMDSKRLRIRYKNDVGPDGATGDDKDGIVEIRRGVKDLSLGESKYAQVRILVDGDRYIKGMAVYSDNMPDGVDVIFNTNKNSDVPMRKVLKEIHSDPDNPFGSLIKANGQNKYTDKDGNEKLSLINKRADEGDWDEWQDALPSQFLGKQSRYMAKRQLDLAKADKSAEYDEICSLENPTIKKHYLEKFAESCDSAAVHLKAAALPGQKYHVIIPVNTLKDTEVYAPGYEEGTKLALIRYPHGGTFEIPILTVTHKNNIGNKIIGKDSIDAVGINKKVADRLSGADFDGDTVMCIPTHDKGGKVKITNKDPLKGLEGFDPKTFYGSDSSKTDADGTTHYFRNGKEYRVMGEKSKGLQMGVISNLITDMTLAGATDSELAAAVRHSMVVIDAPKHKLDYKQSELDNNITALKKKYQQHVDDDGTISYGGASTILSRSKGEATVLKRQGTYKVNMPGEDWYDPSKPVGAKIHKIADDVEYTVAKIDRRSKEEPNGTVRVSKKGTRYVEYDDTGKWVPVDGKSDIPDGTRVVATPSTKTRTQKSTNMAEADDAYNLVSDARHPMELLYADYANSMKVMANQARKERVSTKDIEYSKTAADTYKEEVISLKNKVREATLNAPRERAANRKANAEVSAKKEADKSLTASDIKKLKQQALTKYRSELGAVKRSERAIKITDREWDAIQAGAISKSMFKELLDNADPDELRQRAMPRVTNTLSTAKINKIKAMSNSNYSLSEIANALGVSTSTVSNYLKGAK